MSRLRIYQREPEVYTLGPGKRYCLWVQGCPRRCPGCVSIHSQDPQGGYWMEPGAIAMEIRLSRPDGITISGGEPFLQAKALAQMLGILREQMRCDLGVIVYTGYTLEELETVPDAGLLLPYIDLLIDGPYVRELDDGLSLRGSANQRVIPLTDRYRKPEVLNLFGQKTRTVQIIPHGFGISRVGVINPSDTDYKEIKT